MRTGIKVAMAVLLLAVAILWGLRAREQTEPVESMQRTVLQEPEPLSPRRPGPAREAATSPGTTSPEPVQVSIAGAALVRGRVVDPDHAPLAGIHLGLIDAVSFRDLDVPVGVSDEDGAFEMPVPGPAFDVMPIALDAARATLARELRDGEWLLVLTGTAAYAGKVVDETGAPIAGAGVAVEPRRALFRELGLFRPPDLYQDGWKTSTDSDGRFVVTAAPAGPIELHASAVGFSPRWVSVPAGLEQQARIVLERPEGGVLVHGIVLGPADEPLAGAGVSTLGSANQVLSGEDGSFTILWAPARKSRVNRLDGATIGLAETHIHAAKAGFRPALAELAQLDLRETIVLRLLEELTITGRVVDPSGEPLAGVLLWPSDPTPLGTVVGGDLQAPVLGPLNLENVVHGSEGRCVTSEDGRFRLDQLMPRTYRLRAFAPKTAALGGPWSLEAGASELTLVLDQPTRRVAGRLISMQGEPYASARCQPAPAALEDLSFELILRNGVSTDGEGRFEFPELVVEGTILGCFHQDFFFFSLPLDETADLEHLEIVVPRLCELQIELTSTPDLARRAKFLDGAGGALCAQRYEGNFGTVDPWIRLTGGKSDVVRVSEAARILVLLEEEREVLRLPIQLDPGRRTTVRL